MLRTTASFWHSKTLDLSQTYPVLIGKLMNTALSLPTRASRAFCTAKARLSWVFKSKISFNYNRVVSLLHNAHSSITKQLLLQFLSPMLLFRRKSHIKSHIISTDGNGNRNLALCPILSKLDHEYFVSSVITY